MTEHVTKDAGPARLETFLRVKRQGGTGFNFTGWATTSDLDLVGDQISPGGAVYELPIVLLWQHDHSTPVGVVEAAHMSGKGIRVNFRLLPEVAKAREAVALIEAGALALSIGFLPLESEPLPSGGRRYKSWRWTELSCVSVACNPQAKIDRIGKGLVIATAPVIAAEIRPRYVPVPHDLAADFEAAAKSLPDSLAGKASARTSCRTGERWTIRDDSGLTLGIVPPIAPPVPAPKRAPAAPQAKGVTPAMLDAVTRGIADAVAGKLRDLITRIESLEAAAAEAGIRFKGFYRDGAAYRLGDATTHDGSLWVAVRATNEPPAPTSPDWCLAARKGRDAR